MKIIATNGTETGRVTLAHWWPGRLTFEIPYHVIRKAYQDRTRYLTYIRAEVGDGEVTAWARCHPVKDRQSSREKGRFIALLRLARALKKLGWRLEKRD